MKQDNDDAIAGLQKQLTAEDKAALESQNSLIELLEGLVTQAKLGRIVGIAFSATGPESTIMVSATGGNTQAMIAGLEEIKRRLLDVLFVRDKKPTGGLILPRRQ